GIFQTAGGGHYYLADASTNRGAATTNISPALLADLAQKTTYPPLVHAQSVLSPTNIALSPRAQRENQSAPDIGWAYDPLDYEYAWTWTTNAIAITVNPGTAIGCFGIGAGGYGLAVSAGSSLTSIGTPTAPNHFVEYSAVQEQPDFEAPY